MACAPSAAMCPRDCSLRTVAVTRAPTITPSCTAAIPTPPAAPRPPPPPPPRRGGAAPPPPRRAVDQQPLAHGQPRLGEERVVGGGEDLGHAAGGRPVELLGHRHRRRLVHDGELRMAAAGH